MNTALSTRNHQETPGFRRYLLLIVLCLSYMLVFTQRTGPGVISNQLQAQFHVTAAVLGTMASIQYFLYMILQIPVGLTADKIGPERLLISGLAMDGVGTIIFANSHDFAWLLSGRAIVGLGDALIWVNLVLILGRRYLPSEFAAFLGIAGTAGNLGAVLTTIPLAAWIGAAGWRAPFTWVGISLLVIALIDVLVLSRGTRTRSRKETPTVTHRGQAATGELAPAEHVVDHRTVAVDAAQAVDADQAVGNHADVEQAAEQPGIKLQPIPVKRLLHDVVRDRIAWITFACHCGAMGCYIGFTSLWAVPFFMTVYGVSRFGATSFTLAAFVGAMVGGPVIGAVSERLGQRRMPYLVIQTLGALAWLSVVCANGHPWRWAAYVIMFVIGVTCGGSLLTFAVVRDTVEPTRAGVTSGFANTGGFVSAVLLPILFGLVMDVIDPKGAQTQGLEVHAFGVAFLVPFLFSLVGVIGSWFIPRRQTQGV